MGGGEGGKAGGTGGGIGGSGGCGGGGGSGGAPGGAGGKGGEGDCGGMGGGKGGGGAFGPVTSSQMRSSESESHRAWPVCRMVTWLPTTPRHCEPKGPAAMGVAPAKQRVAELPKSPKSWPTQTSNGERKLWTMNDSIRLYTKTFPTLVDGGMRMLSHWPVRAFDEQ